MSTTIEVLRAEAIRLRALAAKIDALVGEIEGASVSQRPADLPGLTIPVVKNPNGEFGGMSQRDAIIRALQIYGPQTTRELYDRLNRSGQAFRNTTYVSSVIARMKGVIGRTLEGKCEIRTSGHQSAQTAA